MEKFTSLTTTACPLGQENIDTDQILPARFLKLPRSSGLGRVLFHDLRFDSDANERPDFLLNRPACRDARIVIAGRNFGGGSSREAAVYALYDFGIRCVIAPSFGDIFAQNAAMNGLLSATVVERDVAALTAMLTNNPRLPVTVDLETQTVTCGGHACNFTIDPARRIRLLNGWDDIDLTENFRGQIQAFKIADLQRRPWAIPDAGK